jgi:ATP-binding cassette subfamily B protein/subfamily B ATP-binding cassette protein MsbA
LDAGLAMVALAVTPLLALCIRVFAKPMSKRTYACYEQQGNIMAQAEQILTALPLVRLFAQEKSEHGRLVATWRESDHAQRRLVRSEMQFKFATGAVTALGTAFVMALGGFHVWHGQLSLGELLVFLTYLAALYAPLETLAYLSSGWAAAKAGAQRVFEVFDDTEHVREHSHPQVLPVDLTTNGARLRFENVAFGYEPGRPVLQDINLEIKPGEVVAVVGATGAGKSTLAALVPRFFDPWHGRITLNGVDLCELKLAELRDQIGFVLQDPFILPLTIRENITYGKPEASREAMIAAAVGAQAHEFVSQLADGYDTVVGERGATLSGGQLQRLAIARALLKNTPILILDEPTAALDAHTESLLQKCLQRLLQGRTSLLIAHRLSTVRLATRIVVLDQGRMVEQGTHQELMSLRGFYRRLYEAQFREVAA